MAVYNNDTEHQALEDQLLQRQPADIANPPPDFLPGANKPYEAGGITGAKPTLQIPTGASGPEAAKYLMSTGMKGKDVTDYLAGQGYKDNGLYYDNNGMYGFSDAYIGPDGNIVQRVKERPASGGGVPTSSGPSSFQGIQGLMPTDTDFYTRLQQLLQDRVGGPSSTSRDALLELGAK